MQLVLWLNGCGQLDAPVARCAGMDKPIPFNAGLEKQFMANKYFEGMLVKLIGY